MRPDHRRPEQVEDQPTGMVVMGEKMEFYVGIQKIADFLGLHWRTCARYLREGKIAAAKKDSMGRWVLTDLDYYRSLRDVREVRPQA